MLWIHHAKQVVMDVRNFCDFAHKILRVSNFCGVTCEAKIWKKGGGHCPPNHEKRSMMRTRENDTTVEGFHWRHETSSFTSSLCCGFRNLFDFHHWSFPSRTFISMFTNVFHWCVIVWDSGTKLDFSFFSFPFMIRLRHRQQRFAFCILHLIVSLFFMYQSSVSYCLIFSAATTSAIPWSLLSHSFFWLLSLASA